MSISLEQIWLYLFIKESWDSLIFFVQKLITKSHNGKLTIAKCNIHCDFSQKGKKNERKRIFTIVMSTNFRKSWNSCVYCNESTTTLRTTIASYTPTHEKRIKCIFVLLFALLTALWYGFDKIKCLCSRNKMNQKVTFCAMSFILNSIV